MKQGDITKFGSGTPTHGDRLYYDGTEWIRMPACYFNVGGSTQTNLAVGTTLIENPTVNVDVGGDYDNTTNYNFTAPVTGFYFFTVHLKLSNIDSAATAVSVQMIGGNSNSANMDPRQMAGDIAGSWSLNFAQAMRLSASNTVHINYEQSGGAAQTDVVNCVFSGFLISPIA
jgi:hypothetical protein